MTFAAAPEIVLAHGGNTVRLRPTLRAAVTLERLHEGGFPALFRKVSELDTTTIGLVITCASTDSGAARAYLKSLGERPLRDCLPALQGPLLTLCLNLIPTPDETDDTPELSPKPHDKPTGWPDAFKRLYGFATGWLGWTPETAWNSTPTEITDAFQAHCDKLRSIHGAAEDDDTTSSTTDTRNVAEIIQNGSDPTLDRAGLHALQGLRSVM